METKTQLEIEKLKREIEKVDSENEKIKLESKELRKGFWKKPQWWVFFTTLATLGTLWGNGTFNAVRVKTEAEFALLKLEKKEFENERDRLDTLIKQKTDSLGIITDSLNEIKSKNNALIIENSNLVKINKQLKSGMSNVVSELIDSVKQLNTKLTAVSQINRIRFSEKEFTIPSGTPPVNSVVKLTSDLKNKIIDIGIEGEGIIEKIFIRISNYQGGGMYSKEFRKSEYKANIPVDISRFPKGEYYLRIIFSTGGGRMPSFFLL